jgi:hypothetical protein
MKIAVTIESVMTEQDQRVSRILGINPSALGVGFCVLRDWRVRAVERK